MRRGVQRVTRVTVLTWDSLSSSSFFAVVLHDFASFTFLLLLLCSPLFVSSHLRALLFLFHFSSSLSLFFFHSLFCDSRKKAGVRHSGVFSLLFLFSRRVGHSFLLNSTPLSLSLPSLSLSQSLCRSANSVSWVCLHSLLRHSV